MTSRRRFLAGAAALGVAPTLSWADLGRPAFVSAALQPDGQHVFCGVSEEGQVTFRLPVPDRGHAAAVHPDRAELVGFARRPGRFALVIDAAQGREVARMAAPEGRHFYGHGCYSADGRFLYTTENDYEAGQGVIGVWDRDLGYARVGEMPSGGVGPHDLRLMPDGRTLVVANGGIETHPETGRSKLNIPMMRPNLTYIDLANDARQQVELPQEMHKNSIRHLAIAPDGQVGIALQWQGDLTEHVSVFALHNPGAALRMAGMSRTDAARMRGYGGSIAVSRDGESFAVTSPRGGVVALFSAAGQVLGLVEIADVCGVVATRHGFLATNGLGQVYWLSPSGAEMLQALDLAWDNHLIPV